MAEFRVGILGTGQIAGGYDLDRAPGERGVFTHAGAYRAQGGFRLAWAADPDAASLARFAAAWHPEQTTQDVDRLLLEPLDVLSICSPNACHVEQVLRALEAGQVRALWVEKPFAPTLGEAETIRQLAFLHQVQLLINFQRRFDPVLLALRERLRGEDIRLVRGLYHKGWSHMGTTLVDLAHLLFGPPERVEARSHGATGSGDLILDVQMHWAGFTGHLLALDSPGAPSPCHVFDLEIFTARERILITDNSRRILVHPIGDYAYGGVKVYLPEAEAQQTDFDQSMVHSAGFMEGFLRGDQAWSERPLLDNLEVCATVQAGLEAARQNVPIFLPPVPPDLEMS